MAATRPFLRRGPSGPLAASSIIQMGYDEVVEEVGLPASFGAFVPRNEAGDPLRVVLPNVTPGNFLEIDFRMQFTSEDIYYYAELEIDFVAIVSFDGSDPVIGPPSFLLFNSSAGVVADPLDDPGSRRRNCNSIAVGEIPEGATVATVEILYQGGPVEFDIEVDDEPELQESAGTLKVTELNADVMTQPGPGEFVLVVV